MRIGLKAALELLHQPELLETQPLVQARCIQEWIARNPKETAGKSLGQAIALALAGFWRSEFHPGQVPMRLASAENSTKRAVIQIERFLMLELKYFKPLRQASGRPLHDEEVLAELQNIEALGTVLAESGTRLEQGWKQYLEETIGQRALELQVTTFRYHRDKAIIAFEDRLMAIEEELNNLLTGHAEGKAPPRLQPDLDSRLASALAWNILRHRVASLDRLEAQIENSLAGVHPPDRVLIRGFATQADHELLHCIGRYLALRWKNRPSESPYPVLLDLSQYAQVANTEGLISYASSRLLSNLDPDRSARAAFQTTLANLEAEGQLIWIAGTWDALTTEETKLVLPRFREVTHYVLHTRAWEPHLEFSQRCELPIPLIENPGKFIRERLDITPQLFGNLQLKLGKVAYWHLNRGGYGRVSPDRLIFHESEIGYLDLAERQAYLEQARRAGIILYDGVSFRCDAGIVDYLAGWYALFDPFCDYFDLVEIALRWHDHPLIQGIAQVLAYTKDWQRLDQVIQAFTAFSSTGGRLQRAEMLGLGVLAAADLAIQVKQLAKPELPVACIARIGEMLEQLATMSSSVEVHDAVAQRLDQLGLAQGIVLRRPADRPIVAPSRPQSTAVSQVLTQLGQGKLAFRATNGSGWASDAEIIDALIAGLQQPQVDQKTLVACLYHADLGQRLLPKKKGFAAYLEEPPVALEYLVELAIAEPDPQRKSRLMSILARPEILGYLARRKTSGELRSLLQSLALVLDARVIRSNGMPEVIKRAAGILEASGR